MILSSNMFGIGVRFVPTDAELIYHLRNKISNPDYCHPSIVVADVYKQAPWCLPWDPAKNRFFLANERYYFVKRMGTGKRAKRTLDLGGDVEGATWKPNQKATPILDEGTGATIGYVTSLTLIFKNKGKGDWIMHEYMIDNEKSVPEYWILCRVKYTGKGSLFMASTSTSTATDALPQTPESIVISEGPDSLPPFKRRRNVELVQEPPNPVQETRGLEDIEGYTGEGSLFMASTSTSTVPDSLPQTPQSVVVSEGPDLLPPLKRQRTVELVQDPTTLVQLETGGLKDMEGSFVEGEGADDTELCVDELERMLKQSDQEEDGLAVESLVDQLEQPLEVSGEGDHQGLVEENMWENLNLVDDQQGLVEENFWDNLNLVDDQAFSDED
ncbi:hypothetical protein SLEP1_g33218 [Rubroshorea leprosula]|uniref:NAC domain-containing protein n=1 Tax=Rubroshorea leprosula TaxID=152421 RepID=A0AAV5KFX7_9ROSI|nr:hypothetical protein SLEP1_g33218 [Rubroshorea leprosula]